MEQRSERPGLNTSLSTGNPYRGINQLLLQLAAGHHGFQSKWWGTFNQIKASGGYVLKGEKGTHVVLFKPIKRTRVDETGEETDDSFLRPAHVHGVQRRTDQRA